MKLYDFGEFLSWPSVSRRVAHPSRFAACEHGSTIIDDTVIPAEGNSFVGVARQYSGTLGKAGNSPVVVSLQYTDARDTRRVSARLYLPRKRTDDTERCHEAHVPDDLVFRPKTDIAIGLLDQADAIGVPYETVVFDSGYGERRPRIERITDTDLPPSAPGVAGFSYLQTYEGQHGGSQAQLPDEPIHCRRVGAVRPRTGLRPGVSHVAGQY